MKLDNVLIRFRNATPYALISDFGFAMRAAKDSVETFANSYKGTKKGYMAPELHQLLTEQKAYDPFKVDTFAMGVLIFAALFNRLPFEYATTTDAHYSLLVGGNIETFWSKHKISTDTHPEIPMLADLKQLLERMFAFDPHTRFSIEEVR